MWKPFYGTGRKEEIMLLESPTKTSRWPVVRVVPGHDKQVTLLSGDWLRLGTHYFGRTFLCTENDLCPCCSLLPSRPYWYLPCLIHPVKNPGLLELSATTSADLEQRAKMLHEDVHSGLMLRLTRRSPKKPVYVEIVDDVGMMAELTLQEWVSAVMAVYCLPPLRVGEGIVEYSARIQGSVIERGEVQAARLKAAAEKGIKGRG